ncbi:MAG: hypothetical protein KBC38_00665 [Candidatus Pacebacteria bacterium]|nr:hypothetical protein [Candidatus Paceibacterota bacterium]MBP9840508.1 hypothetical protein [Candidatus Paceibacterota bacterium]
MPTPRTVNDIIPPSRRRRIEPDAPEAPREPAPVMEDMHVDMPPPPETPPPLRPLPPMHPAPRRRFPWGTALIAILVVLASVAALWLFSGASVSITPKTQSGSVSQEYTATPDGGDLPFRVVSTEKIASKSVPAESTVNANDAAEGTITVYNTSATPQRFVKNTRFESPNGLIYRARDAINVPAGSASSPGTTKVAVFAETGGEQYNIAPTDFTLPGLDGTPEGKQVYGKSTESFVGGFLGNRPSVSEATATRERVALQAELPAAVLDGLREATPEGYVLIPGSENVLYSPLPDAPDGSGGVYVRHKATATAAVFPADALSRAVAQVIIGQGYAGQPVQLTNVDQLRVTPKAPVSAADPFEFTLSGTGSIVWEVDPNKIAGQVSGKTRDAARVLISGLPEIGEGVITLRPFWAGTLPEDPTEIKVTVVAPKQ